MISILQALTLITQNRQAPKVETVSLTQALGRTLASDIAARLTQPPLDSSAMDGYAVKLDDIQSTGTQLKVIGEAPAGAPFMDPVNQGEAVRIFTGGAVPKGADTIIIQENVKADGTKITILEPQSSKRHIRRKGLDFNQGDILIKSGTTLGPAEIAVAAASGHAQINVSQKLSVAILSGGDELISPGDMPKPGQIINSNPFALAALIESWGHEAVILPTAKDTIDSILARIKSANASDVIIPVGGASVGDHDHMRRAFKAAGLEVIFEKVAVRPGKPTWFGTLKGKPVLGLPGNPASALVCAQLFAKLLLTGNAPQNVTCRLSEDSRANGPRESYQRAVVSSIEGTLYVKPLPIQDSGLITPFLSANGLLRLPANCPALTAEDLAEVLLINPLI